MKTKNSVCSFLGKLGQIFNRWQRAQPWYSSSSLPNLFEAYL